MSRMVRIVVFLLAALPLPASGDEIRVAAASDLTFAMTELAAGFQTATGHRPVVISGSSGNFFSQIQNGAPFDLFFSADVDYAQRLEKEGLAEPGSLRLYAEGKIVLWVRNDSPLDVSQGWRAVTDARARKIAIANPQHAPYGRAAVEAMRGAGVYEQVSSRLVFGENISQAAQFVNSGNAEIGILALSVAEAPTMKERGRWWRIPENSYAPLDQAAIVLRSSQKKEVARAFLNYVLSDRGGAILRRFGFVLPTSARASRP